MTVMAGLGRNAKRLKRRARIRRRVVGTPERPRLCVYKSLRHIYAQIVDDVHGRALTAASTLSPEIRGQVASANVDVARRVGQLIAQRARERGIERVVFDRSGYPYHGQVRALAEAAREEGLLF